MLCWEGSVDVRPSGVARMARACPDRARWLAAGMQCTRQGCHAAARASAPRAHVAIATYRTVMSFSSPSPSPMMYKTIAAQYENFVRFPTQRNTSISISSSRHRHFYRLIDKSHDPSRALSLRVDLLNMSYRGVLQEAGLKTGGCAAFLSARQPGRSMKYGRVDRCVRRGGVGRRCAGMPGTRFVVQAVAAPGGFTAWDTAVQRVPKRTDIKTIMLLGAGPIVIGQVRGRISVGFQNRVSCRACGGREWPGRADWWDGGLLDWWEVRCS